MQPLIALTTDFGPGSTYVAQLKGVLLSAVPQARLIDLTHSIPPHDLKAATLFLRSTAFGLPLETTHLVVVDPGVGSARRPIAVRARGINFVGPDNGVLSIATSQPQAQVVELNRPEYFSAPVSPTFHGRDLFAPAAAEIASGVPLDQMGSTISDPKPTCLPQAQKSGDAIYGETLGCDRFGNLLTNVPASWLSEGCSVKVNHESVPMFATYSEAPNDRLFALIGSDGYLEIALREASASVQLGAVEGIRIECSSNPEHTAQ